MEPRAPLPLQHILFVEQKVTIFEQILKIYRKYGNIYRYV